MGNIKKRVIKGYILLESLLATGLFALLVSLILTGIETSRRYHAQALANEEAYQAVKMALQTKASSLEINGQSIKVNRSEKELRVYSKGEEILVISEK